MKAIIISVVVVATLLVIMFVDFAPKATVIAPEIKKTSDYKRPVREGNCWRQFIGTGTNDSILVCH